MPWGLVETNGANSSRATNSGSMPRPSSVTRTHTWPSSAAPSTSTWEAPASAAFITRFVNTLLSSSGWALHGRGPATRHATSAPTPWRHSRPHASRSAARSTGRACTGGPWRSSFRRSVSCPIWATAWPMPASASAQNSGFSRLRWMLRARRPSWLVTFFMSWMKNVESWCRAAVSRLRARSWASWRLRTATAVWAAMAATSSRSSRWYEAPEMRAPSTTRPMRWSPKRRGR